MRWVLLVLIAASAGCATVRPYERARLQSPVMAFPGDPLQQRNDAHILGTRETMTGGTGGGSSSCGCT